MLKDSQLTKNTFASTSPVNMGSVTFVKTPPESTLLLMYELERINCMIAIASPLQFSPVETSEMHRMKHIFREMYQSTFYKLQNTSNF